MSKQFERTLEAATDQVVVDTDWSGIMECIDMVRGKDVSAKDAASAISRRLKNSNPNIVHHTLVLLEACMKNCGTAFHAEIMSTKFLEQLRDIVTASPQGKVQEKILELIQVWHSAFAKKQEYGAISDVHRILKHSGYKFPAAKESDVMFAAQCAPDWLDGDQCFRCRSEFGLFNRKHHCRACGQIFCDRCSSQQLFLPQFGIEKKVRVCDTCYEKNNKKSVTQGAKKDGDDEKRRLKELEEKEEEELALAIALSQSEAEQKKHRDRQWTPITTETTAYGPPSNDGYESISYGGTESVYKGAAMSVIEDRPLPADNLSVDSNLARYLDRVYWEKKLNDTSANAPPQSDVSSLRNGTNNYMSQSNNHADVVKQHVDHAFSLDSVTKKVQNMGLDEDEAGTAKTKTFCDQTKDRIDTMDNRMRSNLMRGRSIVNDSSIHGLFVQLTDMHGDVLERLNTLENEREYYERLQDHLAHIQESRQAVNALREEHERQRQERLLAEQRERQAQMQQKLAIMRIKKQEMILHQRHVALQRFQEQEQNMQQRKNMGMPPQQQPQASMPLQQQQPDMHQLGMSSTSQGGFPSVPQYMMPPNMYPQGYNQLNSQQEMILQQRNGGFQRFQEQEQNGQQPKNMGMPPQQQQQASMPFQHQPTMHQNGMPSTPQAGFPSVPQYMMPPNMYPQGYNQFNSQQSMYMNPNQPSQQQQFYQGNPQQ